jgi:hypothetical protein
MPVVGGKKIPVNFALLICSMMIKEESKLTKQTRCENSISSALGMLISALMVEARPI